MAKQTASAHALLIFACVAWGGSYAVGRYGLSDGSPLWLTLWRWGPGAIIFALYLMIKWRSIAPVVARYWLRLTLISLLGVVIYPVTLFMAVAQTTALNASLYLAATPVLIVFTSSIVWKDRLGVTALVAVALGVLGALVLFFQGSMAALLEFKIAKNDIWAIFSALAWAAYCVSLPLKPKELTEIPFLAIIVVIGTIVLLGLALAEGTSDLPLPKTPAVAWSMAFFAIFPSVLAFLAWNWGTTLVGSATAAPYNNLVPFLGGALGIIFLHEKIEKYHIVGGVLIVAGLLINGIRRNEKINSRAEQ